MASHSKPLILFFSPVRHAKAFYEELAKVARVEVGNSKSRDEFFRDVHHKYKGFSVIYRTSSSGVIAGNFDADFIRRLPPSCKTICHNGAGYDQIDTQACKEHGVTLTYAPDPVTEATADLALWLMLGALRQLNPALNSLRAGDFKRGIEFGHDPKHKILGILGMGRIGRALKARCEPLQMITRYHNRNQLEAAEAGGAEWVSFERLLTESDVISVHVPLNAGTRHLIGAKEISQMKDGVVIVNTARGAIIDEEAMANALESSKIAGVGLDVYEREPAINEKLMKNERALLVPHLGTHTTETLAKMEICAMENARRAVLGEPLLTPVPEHSHSQVEE